MKENFQDLQSRLVQEFKSRVRQDFIGACVFALTFCSPDELHSLVDMSVEQHSRDLPESNSD